MLYNKIPLIEVSGSNYDIGFEIGKKMKSNIKKTINIPEKIANEHKYFKIDYFIRTAKKYLPIAQKYFPNIISEIKGIAEGSSQDFDDIWLLNLEEIWGDDYFDKCTSIVIREIDDNIYLYHNEDFDNSFENNIAIIKANVNNKVKFLSLTFAGMVPGSSVSLNSFGLIQGINSLHPVDYKIGIPKNIISRAILESNSIKDALKIIKNNHRASAYNHILIQNNKIVNIETTTFKYNILNVKANFFVHTNNYLCKKFIDNFTPIYSRNRLNTAFRILQNAPAIDKNVVMAILTSHDKDVVFCKHKKNKYSEMTISSMIVDSNNLKLYATNGNPCKNKYDVYSLE